MPVRLGPCESHHQESRVWNRRHAAASRARHLGVGDWTTFFSNPARTGVIILAFAGAIAYAFSGSSSLGIGQREDPSSRRIFVPVIIIAIVFAWLPPHLDHLDRWSIDGDTVRYTGLIITAIGGFVRIATVFELGHRFSIFVALQPHHRLKTDGFYQFVRHPSYLGALLAMAGWALVFRSIIGLLLTAAMCVPIVARIRAEEEFLVREFGEQYRLPTTHPLAVIPAHLLRFDRVSEAFTRSVLRSIMSTSMSMSSSFVLRHLICWSLTSHSRSLHAPCPPFGRTRRGELLALHCGPVCSSSIKRGMSLSFA
jgi:protein-S-isoprenylcysteine O-methyltransferase Ste14